MVPMGYRPQGHRTVPFSCGASRSPRWPVPAPGPEQRVVPPPMVLADERRAPSVLRDRIGRRRPPAALTVPPRRAPTPCAGSPPRSAAARTWPACSRTSSTRPFALFGVDRAGLWMYDPAAATPLTSPPSVASRRSSSTPSRASRWTPGRAGCTRCASGGSASWTVRCDPRRRRSARSTAPSGSRPSATCRSCSAMSRSACWSSTTTTVRLDRRRDGRWHGRSATSMATAIGSARLADSARTLASRLTSISELAGRLGHLQDLDGIAWAIVAEARRLIDHDTIRVYRVDRDAGHVRTDRLPGHLPRHEPNRTRPPCGSRSARA